MELIKSNLNIDFLGKRALWVSISLLLAAFCIYVWVSQGEDKYGVDFKGGAEVIVKMSVDTNSEALRAALEKGGVEDPTVQSFEAGSNSYSIRFGGIPEGKSVKDFVAEALKKSFDDKFEITRSDSVGPTIGQELRKQALIAIALGLLMILAYVTYRFEFAFALGAVVAVFHDVIISTGLYLFAGYTLNMAAIAAALTIIGYSVNDTIVIFDRVREDLVKEKEDVDLITLMNASINATLSRTIITNMLTFFSVVALYVFGGGVIADLSFFLLMGMIAGTYSTIYIASPVVIAWEGFRRGREARTNPA